ncbi:hypothetical protein NG799_10145 [Laspinema sp. D1]|uniref:Uncharacterized protein n=1 Tax=Laspinema palackyanum D2a TaxID=2953684 RepID=A0ABT2MRZ6_9CYAN|nr:hypothetical protein [Laspinema sp. D2a]
MFGKQLSLFEDWQSSSPEEATWDVYETGSFDVIKIILSGLAAEVIAFDKTEWATLAQAPEAVPIARSLGNSQLVRRLNLAQIHPESPTEFKLKFKQELVFYQKQKIGIVQILFKSALPGELQAKLAIGSAIDRFLDYLQAVHKIVCLDESDYHVRVFIPGKYPKLNFTQLWEKFLREVAFSAYGNPQHQLPGLVQTFIQMLNTITLSGRGFSTLDLPILAQEQATVLAALYRAVVRDVQERQQKRQNEIERLQRELNQGELKDKERDSKQKDLQKKQEMQEKEAKKYCDLFQKGFGKIIEEHQAVFEELDAVDRELAKPGLGKPEQRKLLKQQEKLGNKIVFSRESVGQKARLLARSQGNPFELVRLDRQEHPGKFQKIEQVAQSFNKTATDQINSTVGAIFSQCVLEMYRLLELKSDQLDPLPPPLLSEKPAIWGVRSPGDDSKEFCYSCGIELDPKTARWQVLRFMFERPSQRRQSASTEGRPHICASCAALAFASPLKVTNESLILQLEPATHENPKNFAAKKQKIKEYLRMLTNKQLHLSAGRYVVLASDRTSNGDIASEKLGQVQYALAKVASIFPREVLADFEFSLIIQGSQPIRLTRRHLTFIKGLMEGYSQSIIESGKEINMKLGEAIRYVEKDLPAMAEYTLAKLANLEKRRELEQTRESYANLIQQDVQGFSMCANNQLSKRATLYKDVAALTGLTLAFVQSLERTAKQSMKLEDAEREVSKIIEKIDDAVAFCYYATLGDEKKTSVQARLYRNPDNYFIYEQVQRLLAELGIKNREHTDETDKQNQQTWLLLYADDVMRAYAHFAENGYTQDKEWKELTYQLKLSLYTRFPELVRKLKSKTEKN